MSFRKLLIRSCSFLGERKEVLRVHAGNRKRKIKESTGGLRKFFVAVAIILSRLLFHLKLVLIEFRIMVCMIKI